MTLTMAFNYGGRAEIVDAVRAHRGATGCAADKVDEKAIRSHLYHPDMPDPDLVVRTSGEYRISNFLLWELAYAELVFTDVLWPDFRRAGPVRRRRRVPGPLAALRGARAVRPRRDGALGARRGQSRARCAWRLVGVALVLAFYGGLWVARTRPVRRLSRAC